MKIASKISHIGQRFFMEFTHWMGKGKNKNRRCDMNNSRFLLHFFLLAAVLSTIENAFATSCQPLKERYFIACYNGECHGVFRVGQVATSKVCGRRTQVADIDPGISRFLVALVQEARKPAPGGIYAFHFSFPHWDYRDGESYDAFEKSFGRSLLRYTGSTAPDLKSLSPAETIMLLEKYAGAHWLTQESADASPSSVQALQERYERKANKEFLLSVGLSTAYWGGFAVALLAFVHSVHVFFYRLYTNIPATRQHLLTPVLVQLAVLAAGVGCIALSVIGFDFWPGIVLIPGVVVVLIAEGWARYRRRAAT